MCGHSCCSHSRPAGGSKIITRLLNAVLSSALVSTLSLTEATAVRVFRSHRSLAASGEQRSLSAQRKHLARVFLCAFIVKKRKMPLENLEEEGLPKNPDLRIAQLKFLLTMDGHRQDAKVKTELMDAIKANSELASRSYFSLLF